MNLTLMLLLHSYPHRDQVTASPRPVPSPRHQEPGPEGPGGEPAGDDDDDDDEPETLRDAPTPPRVPPTHGPGVPEASAVDPRGYS